MNPVLSQSPVCSHTHPAFRCLVSAVLRGLAPSPHPLAGSVLLGSMVPRAPEPAAVDLQVCWAVGAHAGEKQAAAGSAVVILRSANSYRYWSQAIAPSLRHVNPPLTICINFCYMCYLSLQITSQWVGPCASFTHAHASGKDRDRLGERVPAVRLCRWDSWLTLSLTSCVALDKTLSLSVP